MIIMIIFALAALVAIAPLIMSTQATSDSSIGQVIFDEGDGDTAWAEADNTGETIDSILQAETDKAVTGVTFNKNSITLAIGDAGTLTATVLPADATDKSVKWSSSNKAVATIDGNGLVTAISIGQVTVSVTTNDGNYRAFCTVKVMTSALQPTGVTLDKSAMTLQLYGSGQLPATVLPADAANKNVIWISSNRMVANVDVTGKVTGITGGTATITVTTAEGSFTATCVVTVVSPPKGVTLDYTSMTINLYGTGKLTATVSPTNITNENVTWSSSNGMIVNVDSTGKLTGITTGTATITVTTVNGRYTATCVVTVVIPVTSVFIDPPSEIILKKGETWQVSITVSPNNATEKSVIWSSSNDLVATVDSNGLVTAADVGTATIVVTTVDGGFTSTCIIRVIPTNVPVTGMEVDKSEMTLTVGSTRQLTAIVYPDDATDKSVTWFSNEESVATVDSNGFVTAVDEGTAGIFVKTNDGNFVKICIVTVVPNVLATNVEIDEAEMTLTVGSTRQLTAIVYPDDATDKSVTWFSNEESVATVDSNGFVTAVGNGTATITVTMNGGGKTATCVVTVVIPVTGVSLPLAVPLSLGIGTVDLAPLLVVSPTTASDKSVIWYSSNPAIAYVNGAGLVTITGGIINNTVTITATTVDGGFTATCIVLIIT